MSNDKFQYTYSAPTEEERKEIASIRKQYAPAAEETPLERLRKLNRKVKTLPLAVALGLGIGGVLLFGVGLTMVLEWALPVYGVAVAALGAIPTGLAYPVHQALLRRGKKKYGAEILQLSEKILGE